MLQHGSVNESWAKKEVSTCQKPLANASRFLTDPTAPIFDVLTSVNFFWYLSEYRLFYAQNVNVQVQVPFEVAASIPWIIIDFVAMQLSSVRILVPIRFFE